MRPRTETFIEGLITAPRISQFYSNAAQIWIKDETNLDSFMNVKHMLERSMKYWGATFFLFNTAA